MYKPGQYFYSQFVTQNISGVATTADSLPLGNLVRNGMDDFSTQVFFSLVDDGRYTISGVIPNTYQQYDSVGVVASGSVDGSLGKGFMDLGPLDSADWSLSERSQIRHQLGIDGSSASPVSAQPALTVSVTGALPPVILYSGALDNIQIGGVNLRQALTFTSAVLAGVSSGVGPTVWFNDINSSFARLSAIAESGIRTTINLVM